MFGNKQEKAAKEAAGAAEVERLVALSPAALAAELLPAFGDGGAKSQGRSGTAPMQIVQWLMTDFPYHPGLQQLVRCVLAGLQSLEHAGLVERRTSGTGSGGQRYLLTPVGDTVLADGSVAAHLA